MQAWEGEERARVSVPHDHNIPVNIELNVRGHFQAMSLIAPSRNLLQHARPFALRLLTKSNPRRCLTMSSVSGPLEPPLSTKTLPEFFSEDILQRHSGRRALISRKEAPRDHGGPPSYNLGVSTHLAWDFAEFDRHINALARGLLGMGVQKGDRVGVIMGNNRCVTIHSWSSGCVSHSGVFQCVRHAPVGLCEYWSYSGNAEPCLPLG